MSIFKNSWVIGILTGIISGLFVFFVTTLLFDNKRKREYALHVKEANLDIVNALKPYIAEQGLPGYQVLTALIISTSRKYAVDNKDLLTPTQVCEELIREIIGDVYVTSEKKKEYTEKVAEFKESISATSGELRKHQDIHKKDYRNDAISRVSIMISVVILGVMAILLIIMSILVMIDPELARHFLLFPFENNPAGGVIVTLVSTVLTFLGAALGASVAIKMKKKKEHNKPMQISNDTESDENTDDNKAQTAERKT